MRNRNTGSKLYFEELPPISRDCFISAVIPACNEEKTITETLISLSRQKFVNPENFEVIVLANNCSDETARISKEWGKKNPSVNILTVEIETAAENANIGFVRKLLMDEAFARLVGNRFGKGIILTTDADTSVSENWIFENLREIDKGADAVGGRILISKSELEKMNENSRKFHLEDEEYNLLRAEIEALIDDMPFDKNPRHHQHFNASFACTTDIYKKAGGVPQVKFLEDVAFFEALNRIDAKFRHSPAVKVFTSSRHLGRSEVGLSFQLNLWKNLREAGEDFLVESAESITDRFSAKRAARYLWRDFSENLKNKENNYGAILNLAEKMFVTAEFIENELEKHQTFGAFYDSLRCEQAQYHSQKFPLVSIEKALEDLKALVGKLRTQSFFRTSMR